MCNQIIIKDCLKDDFLKAKNEIGEDLYNEKLRLVFNKPVLDFVKTIVINLPGSCYANCSYCIDNYLRKNVTNVEDFFNSCKKTFEQFSDIKEISLTGGSLSAKDFNKLVSMINSYYPNVKITWNTNGILIDEDYNVSTIKYINLHRNSADDILNKKSFVSTKPILSIEKAKELFEEKLCLRITVDENFNIEEYIRFGVPLYINRLLPGNNISEEVFKETLDNLNISDKIDIRRRNEYLNCKYKDIPVRVCIGDKLAEHVPNRYPVYLNVVIIHRSGKVCGSWFEDDKLLYVNN